MFTIPELVSPGALPYTAPAAAVVLASLYILFRHRVGSPDPSCGQCGYGVRGLPTLRCPECGSDLKEVGIRPAAKRLPPPLWLRTIALTLALGLPAFALLKPGLSLAPSYWTGSAKTGLHRPASGRYRAVFLTGDFSRYGWSVPDVPERGELLLIFDGDRDNLTLNYDRSKGTCRWTKPDGTTVSRDADVSSAMLQDWLRDAGFADDDKSAAEAAEIFAETAERYADRGDRDVPGFAQRIARPRRWTELHPPKWAWPLYAAPWIAAWLYFWSRIVRTGRAVRVRRPVAAAGPARELQFPAEAPEAAGVGGPPDEGAALPESGAPYDHGVADETPPEPEVIIDDRRSRN